MNSMGDGDKDWHLQVVEERTESNSRSLFLSYVRDSINHINNHQIRQVDNTLAQMQSDVTDGHDVAGEWQPTSIVQRHHFGRLPALRWNDIRQLQRERRRWRGRVFRKLLIALLDAMATKNCLDRRLHFDAARSHCWQCARRVDRSRSVIRIYVHNSNFIITTFMCN